MPIIRFESSRVEYRLRLRLPHRKTRDVPAPAPISPFSNLAAAAIRHSSLTLGHRAIDVRYRLIETKYTSNLQISYSIGFSSRSSALAAAFAIAVFVTGATRMAKVVVVASRAKIREFFVAALQTYFEPEYDRRPSFFHSSNRTRSSILHIYYIYTYVGRRPRWKRHAPPLRSEIRTNGIARK